MNTQSPTEVQLILPMVRFSFCNVFEPFKNPRDPNAKESYTCHGLINPGDPILETIKEAQRKVARAAWGENLITVTNDDGSNPRQVPEWQAELERLAAKDLVCLHSGARSKPGNEEYAGKFFISANHKKRPRIVKWDPTTRQNVEINAGDPLAPYSGAHGMLIVSIYAQGPKNRPSQWGRRINAQLLGIRLEKHDTAFGGGRVANVDEFGPGASAEVDAPAPASGPASDLV